MAAAVAGLLALGVRAAFLLRVPQPDAAHLGDFAADSVHYVAMAQRLLAGHGYSYWGRGPDAYVSPGYPLLVAACFWLAPAKALAFLRWLQAFLGAATAGIAAHWAGLLAGLAVAFYPPFIWSTGSVLTEVLFLFLFLSYLRLHARLFQQESLRTAVLAGVFFGLAVLTRPIIAPVPVALEVAKRLLPGDRKAPSGLGILLLAAALVNLPWWLRNALVLHRPIFFAAQSANPLLGGLSPEGVAAPPGADPMRFALDYARQALDQNPGAFLRWMTLGKLKAMFWAVYLGGTATGGFLASFVGMQRLLLDLGAAGLILGSIVRKDLWPAAVAAATLTAAQLAFIPESRYAYPVMAVLAIGLGALVDAVKWLYNGASNIREVERDRIWPPRL